MSRRYEDTTKFQPLGADGPAGARATLLVVAKALIEEGYRPVDQIVGYLTTGDPAYITSHKNARLLIRRLDRDQLLEDMVGLYLGGPIHGGRNGDSNGREGSTAASK